MSLQLDKYHRQVKTDRGLIWVDAAGHPLPPLPVGTKQIRTEHGLIWTDASGRVLNETKRPFVRSSHADIHRGSQARAESDREEQAARLRAEQPRTNPKKEPVKVEREIRRYHGTVEYTDEEYRQHDHAEAAKAQQKVEAARRKANDAVLRKREEARKQWKIEDDQKALAKSKEEAGQQFELNTTKAQIADICQSYGLTVADVTVITKKLKRDGTVMLPDMWEHEAKFLKG